MLIYLIPKSNFIDKFNCLSIHFVEVIISSNAYLFNSVKVIVISSSAYIWMLSFQTPKYVLLNFKM